MKTVFFLWCITCSVWAAKEYSRFQVIRVIPRDEKQLATLHKFYDQIQQSVDFWKEPRNVNQPVDIMIGPNLLKEIKTKLIDIGFNITLLIDDVQEKIDQEITSCNYTLNSNDFSYTVYHTIEEIEQWITDFTRDQSLATQVEIGQTYEGKTIRAVKISTGDPGKRAIYLQGGLHAREWISPATMIYVINMLATDTDPEVQQMIGNYDWYIVPSINMDGYKYSWTNDRVWRKNRQPNERCTGTDLNRNYPYKWGGRGASDNQCADTYRGTDPLSATETKTVHQWLQKISDRLALFIDFHSYGQLWLYPWGYTGDRDVPQPDQKVQDKLAKQATAALKKPFDTEYEIGMSGPDMYPASGASEDYGYGTLGVKYTYIVELRDKGQYGFLLPDTEIEPTGIETFEALKILGTNPLK